MSVTDRYFEQHEVISGYGDGYGSGYGDGSGYGYG